MGTHARRFCALFYLYDEQIMRNNFAVKAVRNPFFKQKWYYRRKKAAFGDAFPLSTRFTR
jgi:hypothetical protein